MPNPGVEFSQHQKTAPKADTLVSGDIFAAAAPQYRKALLKDWISRTSGDPKAPVWWGTSREPAASDFLYLGYKPCSSKPSYKF